MYGLLSANKLVLSATLIGIMFAASGCLLAVGAAAGAGGYELHQANKMDQLDEDLEKGRISSEEYLARKKQIEETAIFQ